MAQLIGGQVGAQVLPQGASAAPFRQGAYGESSVSELQPKYYEQAYQGNIFFAAHQAATTFSANGLTSTTAVGLNIYNPATSTKNIVPIQCEIVMTNFVTTSTDVQVVAVLSSASAVTLPVTGGALTAYSAKGVGLATSVAIACQTLTYAAAPIIWKSLYGAFVTTTIASAIPTQNCQVIDLGGSIIIRPGTGMSVVATNASTGIVSVTWMELNP